MDPIQEQQPEQTVTIQVQPQPKEIQIVEKIVYKKQRFHGFFRTLTIIALVIVWFLMLLEALNVFFLDINGFRLTIIYPIFILFSSIIIWSYRGLFWKIFGLILFLVVVGWFFTIWVYSSLNPSTDTKFGSYISSQMSSGATYSKVYLQTLVSDLNIIGKKTNNLIEWNYWSDRKITIFSGYKNNYQFYSLKEERNLNLLQNYYSILSLGINSTQPMYLYVKNLFALQKIDLLDTSAVAVKLHAWAIISDITVWSSLKTLDIESAFADVLIYLPKDVWVQLYYKDLLWKLDLVHFTQKSPWYFESDNMDTVAKKLKITMRTGISRIWIVWME